MHNILTGTYPLSTKLSYISRMKGPVPSGIPLALVRKEDPVPLIPQNGSKFRAMLA